MTTHTRRWRSRRHLRRTYSTRRTEQTVSNASHTKYIYFVSVNVQMTYAWLFLYQIILFPCHVPLGEIALLEGLTVVYKSNIDLFFYVIGSSHENEVSHYISITLPPCNGLNLGEKNKEKSFRLNISTVSYISPKYWTLRSAVLAVSLLKTLNFISLSL